MTVPNNLVYVDGGANVIADNLNTFVQLCPLASDLRAFVGITDMCVFVFGINSPGDGGQGAFFWVDGAGTDDNTNIFVPNGTTEGFWQRLNWVVNGSNSLTLSTGADKTLRLGQDATDTNRNMIALGGSLAEDACIGIFGGANADGLTLFVAAPEAVNISIGAIGVRYQFAANALFPIPDANTVLGDFTNRWAAVYAVNGTIQTSSLAAKTEVADAELGLDFVNKLKPISWRWKDVKDNKKHHGIAVEHLTDALGGAEFGGIHKAPNGAPDGLVYTELIAPLIKAVQELSARVKELEAGRAPDPPADAA